MKQELIDIITTRVITPAYIWDMDELDRKLACIRENLPSDVEIVYALKANPWLVGHLKDLCDGFEACSPGEMRITKRVGVPMDRMVVSGVYKDRYDIASIMDSGREDGVYTVESPAQLDLLQKLAEERKLKLNVLIRVSCGNQFGNDAQTVKRMFMNRMEYANLEFKGLQFYSGTQKRNMDKISRELEFLDGLIKEINRETGAFVDVLEYGPGLFVPYFRQDPDTDEADMIRRLGDMLKGLEFKGRLVLEMGRFIAASCGYYATRIADSKITEGHNYLIVDGGINHLNYYGQNMAMKLPEFTHLKKSERSTTGETQPYIICGSLCTSADMLVKGMPLESPETDDIIVFEKAGAYSVTEGIYLFLSRDMPGIYAYSAKEGLTQVRKVIQTDVWNG